MKEKVCAALSSVFGEGKVSDFWPGEFSPASGSDVVYTEEENKSYERTGARTTKSYCRFRIDIFDFDQDSTSAIACLVDEALAWNADGTGLGMTRTACRDDNTAHRRHKIMRYECIVGEADQRIYGIN